ncbi:MAG TPA: M81 family metallopeptidase [Lunatimonas sp.]|nr:M81 family metallopeptidase [Lunatimonas sp.]
MINKSSIFSVFAFIIFTLLVGQRILAQQNPVIGVGGISHESNSFSLQKTDIEAFGVNLEMPETERKARFFSLENAKTVSSGYIAGAKTEGIELYPALLAGARPDGPVTDAAFDKLVSAMIDQLKSGPKLEGILLNLHGAMVVESHYSGDEEIVRRVREAFGPAMPIVVNLDFHANITPEMVDLSDVVIVYKENPHVDTYERGLQAVNIMAKIVRGEVKPTQFLVKPPMVYNIVFQHTFSEPLLPITTASKELEHQSEILAASVVGGYQYADVPWMGPAVIVVTDNNPKLAEREANRLAGMMWESRERTRLNLPNPAQAVQMAMEHQGRPVVLIDQGDNIGGGSTGDSTFLLEELINQGASGFVVVIFDPQGYQLAEKAGVGDDFSFDVGGKMDAQHGKPVPITGHVRSLHVGQYLETEIRHGGGRYWNMGKTAVIQLEGSTLDEPNLVLLTTRPSSPNSAHQLISNGVYVERQKIIVVKGAIAPKAAYEPIASVMISVDSPGATAVNPVYFDFKNVRAGLFGMGE